MLYLYVAFLTLLSGALITSFVRNKSVSGFINFLLTALSSVCLIYESANIFIENKTLEDKLLSLTPLLNSSFLISLDALSALFLLIIAIVSFCVSMFSWKYLNAYEKHSPKNFYPPIMLLFLSCIGLVCVKDLLFFIIFWEFMTLSSWYIVVFDKEKKEALKGGLQYFITTHVAAVFLILAAVILYSYSKDFSFYEIKKSLQFIIENNSVLAHFILFCIFIAFVTKAGVLPFGFWLPNTYPQPPSSASSFFGGVMSKLAVYALVRFFLSVVPLSFHTQVWGFIVATVGVISIFVGTMAALTQDEAKKLMSFHAIGQVGYMLLGIGVGLYFININPFLGLVALIGGLFHVFNNAIYKSLLFLNAGAIFYKTGTTDLNKVSGLFKVMPAVAVTAIVGALSIAGVPPFNGFLSKLLIFESSIWASQVNECNFIVKFAFIIFGIISVFISAITLASFLKFVNSAFMGKLRGVMDDKKNVPFSMSFSQSLLAVICLLAGVLPFIPLKIIYLAVSSSLDISVPAFSSVFSTNFAGVSISFSEGIGTGAWFPIYVMIFVLILSLIILGFEKYAKAPKREVETWYGGKEHLPEEVVYTGHSFYQPFKKMLSFKIGSIQFVAFYPLNLPSIKISLPYFFIKLLHPDLWLYYPLAKKIENVINFLGNLYQKLTKKTTLWLIGGIVLLMLIIFYLR